MYTTTAYLIKNLTNLHAGSSGTNYGIVDKEIQKESSTNLPIIHASSLKGALRDHMRLWARKRAAARNEKEISCNDRFAIRVIFGSDGGAGENTETKKRESSEDACQKKLDKLPSQGLMRFFDARMVFVPMRSDHRPFYHVSSVETINGALEWLQDLGVPNLPNPLDIDKNANIVFDNKEAYIEDFLCHPADNTQKRAIEAIKKLFDIEHMALLKNEDFQTLMETLPVIARNHLDNGKSVNLWYEEVLPRQCRLVTALSQYDGIDPYDEKDFKKAFGKIYNLLKEETFQIGANASIGYGLCRFSVLGGER
jgi:CRISPR-associated protein Cmr4